MAGLEMTRTASAKKILNCAYGMTKNLIFPPRCPVCDDLVGPMEKYIHKDCRRQLFVIEQPVCLRCGKSVAFEQQEYCDDCKKAVEHHIMYRENDTLKQGKAVFTYKGSIKQTMYRFKYSNRREYSEFFAEMAVDKYAGWIKNCGIDVIIPVPMYRDKKKARGYNQAESFARELSKRTGIPMVKGLVSRVKNTQPLKTLGYAERKNSLEGAFQVMDSIVQYYHILIVDDIYTTGSTIEAIGREIARHCDCQVYAMCVCIGQGS